MRVTDAIGDARSAITYIERRIAELQAAPGESALDSGNLEHYARELRLWKTELADLLEEEAYYRHADPRRTRR